MSLLLFALLTVAGVTLLSPLAHAQRPAESTPVDRLEDAPVYTVQPPGVYTATLAARAHYWRFAVTEATCLKLDMRSASLDSYLEVRDATGRLLAVDDDGGQGLDARLQVRLPRAGAYQVMASTSPSPLATRATRGRYTLEIARCAEDSAPRSEAATDRSGAGVVEVRGLTFRHVAADPAALYVAETVPESVGARAHTAMRTAWQEAPRVSGLPLPADDITVYVVSDWAAFVGESRLSGGEATNPICSASGNSLTGRRIVCSAMALASPEQALDYLTHELTHHLVQGDLVPRRGVAQWYNEGLAEAVMHEVLRVHAPAYARDDQATRVRRVERAARENQLIALTDLTTPGQWASESPGLAYAQARLAVQRLIRIHGMERVVAVVNATDGTPGTFQRAFQRAFGLSVAEFDAQFAAAARDSLATSWSPGHPPTGRQLSANRPLL